MYLRTTQRRNKDGSVVRYYALAENTRHPEKGHVEARVVHSFGRADRLDRAVLERLVASIRRVLAEESGEPVVERAGVGDIEIEAVFELGVAHVVKTLWDRRRDRIHDRREEAEGTPSRSTAGDDHAAAGAAGLEAGLS
jgi:hypothetical protein